MTHHIISSLVEAINRYKRTQGKEDTIIYKDKLLF